MNNRICRIDVRDGQLIPAQAEVWISVVPEKLTPTTEVRGRLMGPRCPFSETVEIAYPLGKPPPSHIPPGQPELNRLVVIPEACLWESESPFLYQGPIELWQDGHLCDRVTLSHGLRYFILGRDGLRLNSRSLMLQGRTASANTDQELLNLRQEGCNLLIAPIKADTLSVWERADRLGFCVLGRVLDHSEDSLRFMAERRKYASCLGWLIEEHNHPPLFNFPPNGLIGLECNSIPPQHYLRSIDFLFAPLDRANLGKPLLVKGEGVAALHSEAVNLGSFL